MYREVNAELWTRVWNIISFIKIKMFKIHVMLGD